MRTLWIWHELSKCTCASDKAVRIQMKHGEDQVPGIQGRQEQCSRAPRKKKETNTENDNLTETTGHEGEGRNVYRSDEDQVNSVTDNSRGNPHKVHKATRRMHLSLEAQRSSRTPETYAKPRWMILSTDTASSSNWDRTENWNRGTHWRQRWTHYSGHNQSSEGNGQGKARAPKGSNST